MATETNKIPDVIGTGNLSVHPRPEVNGDIFHRNGITIREFVAAQLMQGMLANSGRTGRELTRTDKMANDAARMADELLDACELRRRGRVT